MRQVVSMVKDGRVQYALVDEETDELTEFAQILVPEHFGLSETAHLGLNLIEAIGLNGRVRKGGAGRKALPPRDQPSLLDERQHEPAELPPADEDDRQRRNRLARERYHDEKRQREVKRYPSGRALPDPKNKVERYVSLEEVLDVVDQYPDGLRTIHIAERIWRAAEGAGSDTPAPKWVLRSVENRLSMCKMQHRDKGTPLPFHMDTEDRPPNVDGTPSRMRGYVLYCAKPDRERGTGG